MAPTRNRLSKLMTLISSLLLTTKNVDNILLVLGVDEDDPIKEYYTYLEKNLKFVRVVEFKNCGKFLGLSYMWNNMAEKIDYADIYAMIGDDMSFSTKNWDEMIIESFNEKNCPKDKIKMVHCNDGMRGEGNKHCNVSPLCVNFFVHRKYIDSVGYFVEPYMPNTHHDTWVQLVFDTIKRTEYRHDIIIKHLHYSITGEKEDNVSTKLEKHREGIWDNNNWKNEHASKIMQEINILNEIINTSL